MNPLARGMYRAKSRERKELRRSKRGVSIKVNARGIRLVAVKRTEDADAG